MQPFFQNTCNAIPRINNQYVVQNFVKYKNTRIHFQIFNDFNFEPLIFFFVEVAAFSEDDSSSHPLKHCSLYPLLHLNINRKR